MKTIVETKTTDSPLKVRFVKTTILTMIVPLAGPVLTFLPLAVNFTWLA